MDNCTNCKHCHKTKQLVNKEWIEYFICTLWLDSGEKEEPLLLTLGSNVDNTYCECYEEK